MFKKIKFMNFKCSATRRRHFVISSDIYAMVLFIIITLKIRFNFKFLFFVFFTKNTAGRLHSSS